MVKFLRDSQPEHRAEFAPGDRLGGYLIQRLIGIGGMADVYLARHSKLDKEVAIKVLRDHARDRSDLRARFLREGQAASRIRNPHVVEIFDVGSDEDVPYLVMKYLPGPTLEEHLAEHGMLDVREVVHIFLPIVAAVAAGHEEGVIHRDLKPDNVILAIEGHRTRPTVLDFGVSRLITSDPRLTLDSSVVGTPHYMSPEQARGETIDTKTDQYALGVMLYQSITGRLPRDRASVLELLNEVGHKGFEPPTDHRPGLPRDFEDVILKAMAPSRRQRFATMHDLAAALLPFASDNAQAFWSEELGIRAASLDSRAILGPAPSTGSAPVLNDPEQPTLRSAPLPASARKEGPSGTDASMVDSEGGSESIGGSRRLVLGIALALLLVGGAVTTAFVLAPTQPAAEEFVVELRTTPANASIEIDGEVLGTGEIRIAFVRDGAAHQLRVAAEGHETREVVFRDIPPPAHVELSPLSVPPPTPQIPADPDVELAPEETSAGAPQPEATDEASLEAARSARRRARARDRVRVQQEAVPNDPQTSPRSESEAASVPEEAPTWRPRADRSDNLDPWNK